MKNLYFLFLALCVVGLHAIKGPSKQLNRTCRWYNLTSPSLSLSQCPWLCGTAGTACWFALTIKAMSCARASLTPCSWPGCSGRTTSGASERACKSQVRYVGGGFPKKREMLGICIVSVVTLMLLCALSYLL